MVDMSKRPKVIGDGAVDQHCDDCFFALLFVLQAVAVFFLAGYYLAHGGEAELEELVRSEVEASTYVTSVSVKGVLLSTALAVGAVVAFLFVLFEMLERCAYPLIVLMNILLPLACLGLGAELYELSLGASGTHSNYQAGAAACGVVAVLQLLWLCCIWQRIGMTAAILSNVSNVLAEMPGLIGVNYAAALIDVAWCLTCGIALYGGAPQLCELYEVPDGLRSLASVLLLVCLYWGHETIRNVAHVTTCGTVGSWYFFPHVLSQGVACCRPATCDSLRRALTTSFGSIAFGSLILAIVDAIHAVVRRLFEQLPEDNALLNCVRCCVECTLRAIKSCLEWLTEYAFVYIAIYGISFADAGREVHELVVEAGFDAVTQTTLLEGVLWLGKLLGALVGAGAAYAGAGAVMPPTVALSIGAAAGLVTAASGLTVLDSGCKTLFVCFAEEPQAMRARKAELAQNLEAVARLGRDKNASHLIVP